MASNLKYSNGTRDAQQTGLITYAGSGSIIRLYDGTQPANANTAISTQTLLVSLTISGVFGTDSNGTITLGSVTNGTAVASSTATFFRIVKSDGTTVVMDGSVGLSGADLNLNTTTISSSQVVSITAGTIIRANS
jgi:hypothetical protein